MEKEFLQELEEYLQLYEEIIGASASRARGMIDRLGAIDALSRFAVSADLQTGFKILRDNRKLEISFEALILKYCTLFTKEVVEAARWRLENADRL